MSSLYVGQSAPYQDGALRNNDLPTAVPENKYSRSTNLDIAKEFGNNFDYFKDPKTGYVAQAKLREFGDRRPTGNPTDDKMTLLAREILKRPELNRHLNFHDEKNSDLHDGVINRADVQRTIEHHKDENPPVKSYTPASGAAGNSLGNALRGLMNSMESALRAVERALPLSADVRAPNSAVAREFAEKHSYFQDEDSAFVTRRSLEYYANSELTGDPVDDRMTWLAKEILARPQMLHLLDSILHNGMEDGKISQRDAYLVADHYEREERSPSQGNQQPADADESYLQRPGYQGAGPLLLGDERKDPQNIELSNEISDADDAELAAELNNNFDYFNSNKDGGHTITQAQLKEVADRPLKGHWTEKRLILLAREIISRPELNRKLDSDHDSDKPDGIIERGTAERVSKLAME